MDDYEEGPDQAAISAQEEYEQWLDEQMSSQEAAGQSLASGPTSFEAPASLTRR